MPTSSDTRLTDTYIKSLKPRPKRYEVFDAQLPGFGIRVAASGRKSWIVFGRQNGRRLRATLGTYPQISLAEAREGATDALRNMRHGSYEQNKNSRLFEEVLAEWYAREQQFRKSFRQVENAIQLHVLPYLKGRQVEDIRKSDLVRVIDTIADKGARTQANRVRAFVTRFFNWCCERDLLEHSPAASLPKVPGEVTRDRVLSEVELAAVWCAADQVGYPFGPVLQLLILTGQRRDEVARMTWDEVNLIQCTWTIPAERAKNRQKHVVHLSNVAIEVFRSMPRSYDCDFIFTTTGTAPVSGFSKAKLRLDSLSKVTGWRLHDLRRTAATIMAERLQVPPVVVDKILNHRSGAVTGVAAVYQRGEFLKDRKAALEKWGAFVRNLSCQTSSSSSQKAQ